MSQKAGRNVAMSQRSTRVKILRLVVYTMSTMVFGMICSALGPSIPWLAENADVEPETLGWLPAAQAVMCIASGLASSLMALVPKSYHHYLLCALLMWLGVFFMILPVASQSIFALTPVFALQVLPRPWIGQMTNLLVSELYDDASLSSAAQSFNQGGFALGCVFMVLLEELTSAFGGEAMFYIAGSFTGLSSLLFLTLPHPTNPTKTDNRTDTALEMKGDGKDGKDTVKEASRKPLQSHMPSAYTLSCSCLGVLAVGLEVACGTWLITTMSQFGFDSFLPSLCNIIFWTLFAVSRLVVAPCICKCFNLKPSYMIIAGVVVSSISCIPATVWPMALPAVLLAVSGVALGVGPSYAMTISMAKERQELTSVDSAMFAIASSLGAGGVPFVMSRLMSLFGCRTFFPALLGMSVALVVLTKVLGRSGLQTPETKKLQELRDFQEKEDTPDTPYTSYVSSEASEKEGTEGDSEMPVPPVIWTYWEQGWQTAPLVCQICIESWELTNPELTLHKVSAADLPALLPHLCRWERFWELPPGQRSDLVRLALLEKFGGIWVDATLFSGAPVMAWLDGLKQLNKSKRHGLTEPNNATDDKSCDSFEAKDHGFFFVFERDSETWPYDPFLKCNLPISSWFVASTPNHPITSKWLSCLCREVMSSTISYFVIHDSFRKLLEEDAEVLKLYQEVPKVSARHPHLLEFELGFSGTEDNANTLKSSLDIAPMQKLSHKVLQDAFLLALINPHSKPTLLSILLSETRLVKDLAKNLQQAEFTVADGKSEAAFEQRCKALVHSSWHFSMHVPFKHRSSNSNYGVAGVDVTMTHASNSEFSALAAA